ncbi:LrgA [Dyella tabacisoli]|uniref:LrgA n=1 Tax=Dyella tabacisoli TaxID=2282381 RepID=A0A369UU40_9GAMM|nr:LrgA [Dyella tabacisoli]RDD83238.1 LrgA [Dyella tabacisoli]
MSGPSSWSKVEIITSYSLLVVLASIIITRLGFAGVWALPMFDLIFTWAALLAVLGSFWFARHSRTLRFWVVGFASASQLVPMVIRQPVLLLPLLGAAVPVGITLWALIALSKKGGDRGTPRHS